MKKLNVNKSNGPLRIVQRIAVLLIPVMIIMAIGCSGAGAGAGSTETPGDYVAPSLVSASLVGGAAASPSNMVQFSSTAFNPDTFYQDGWYEYSEFIVVPELAYNYNGRFGVDSGFMQSLAPILSDTTFSQYSWTESNVPGMYRMLEDGDSRLYMNETGSHYMFITHNSDTTEWLEVEETSQYKRSIWLQEFAYDSIDMIEITEFDNYVFTRSIRFFDRFDDTDESLLNDTFQVQVFGGIHRTDDPEQQIMGVMKRCTADTTTSPWTITEDVPQRAVAAFDLTQLMIRPTVAELSSTPFLFPYNQFSTYELAGQGDWVAYDQPQGGSGDPVGPQAGETFDSTEFVTRDSVLAFLNSGLRPSNVVEIMILGIPFDQLDGSGILDLPDWQRSDVVVEMGL